MGKVINRRAFLRTAASASAVAAGAGAVTIAAASEHPDAKLLAMAPELDRLYAEHLAASAAYSEAYKPVRAIVGDRPIPLTPGWVTWCENERSERFRHALPEMSKVVDHFYSAASNLAAVMLTIPATTIEGLAAKAKALKFDLGMVGNGEPREEWDVDKERAFDFLQEIERMAQAGRV